MNVVNGKRLLAGLAILGVLGMVLGALNAGTAGGTITIVVAIVPLAAAAAPAAMTLFEGLQLGGLASTLLGGAGKAIGNKREEMERQLRMVRRLAEIKRIREDALKRFDEQVGKGAKLLSTEAESQASTSRQAAARRAAALGRSGDVESFVNPLEQNIYGQAAKAREGYLEDTSRQRLSLGNAFDQSQLQAEAEFSDRPIAPGVSDYLMEVGGTAMKFGSGMEALNAQKDFNTRYLDILQGKMNPSGEQVTGSTQRSVNEYLGSSHGAVNLPYANEAITAPTGVFRPFRLSPFLDRQ